MARPQTGALPANPTASAPGDTVSAGASGDNAALASHRHAREGFGTPGAVTIGADPAAGSASTILHSDHDHGVRVVSILKWGID